MKKIILSSTLFLLVTWSSFAQPKSEDRINSKKIAFITSMLDLTPEESQTFWPVYNQMRKEFNSLKKENRRKGDIKDITEEEASLLIAKSIEVQLKEIDIKKKYNSQLQSIIGAKKLLRLQSVERKFKENMLKNYRDRYMDKRREGGRRK